AGSQRLWLARLDLPTPSLDYLHRWGHPIAYSYVRGRWPLATYQTVYAREPGSAEMPSAGRAFSLAVLARLAERGVGFATLTLHAFHEPRAPPLPMLEAIAGPAHLERAYAAALAGRYLWHEFGDLHLILPRCAPTTSRS